MTGGADFTLAGGRVVTGGGVLAPGWVRVRDGLVDAVGSGTPPEPAGRVRDVGQAWVLPGFVDLHVHGGGGASVTDSAEAMAEAVAFHRRHGTTGTLVSVVTGPLDDMCRVASWAADLAAAGAGPRGHVLGVHLEGPFLSPRRCGAQDVAALLAPEPAALRALLDAGRGHVRVVTLAPELPGALALVAELAARGVVPAVGHTDATYGQAAAAFAAGARLLTHAFNAMRGLHHREPGPVLAALDAPGVVLEVIDDGVHVHDAVVRLLARSSRMALVTDAMAAAGVGDGDYTLGSARVRVTGGRAVLPGSGVIAGSTLTMGEAVRRAVRDVGLPVEVASAAASAVPARLLGVADRYGRIAPGCVADLLLLDDDLRLIEVIGSAV